MRVGRLQAFSQLLALKIDSIQAFSNHRKVEDNKQLLLLAQRLIKPLTDLLPLRARRPGVVSIGIKMDVTPSTEGSSSSQELDVECETNSEDEGMDSQAQATSDSELDPATRDIPFGQLLQHNQDGWTGGSRSQPGNAQEAIQFRKVKRAGLSPEEWNAKAKKRENKNRPMEVSSKRPVPRLRQIFDAPSRKKWDPRFSETTGTLKDDVFQKRYAFIFDESLPQEKEETQKAMRKTKSAGRRQELKATLTRIQQQIRSAKEDRHRKEAEAAAKAGEREAVKHGKKPFFLKRSEKKKQELIRRYNDLKASGKLHKVMAKKRKKNASKDHRYMPAERRS